MKNFLLVLCITILAIIVFFVSLYSIDNKKEVNNPKITTQDAINLVRKALDKKSIETITNLDNPEIKEVIFDTQSAIYLFDNKQDIVGKVMYEITFRTTQDGLLGPIVFYVDKSTGKLIGVGYRE